MKALKYLNKYLFKYRVRLLLGIIFVTLSNLFAVYTAPLVRYAVDFIKEATEKGKFTAEHINEQLLYYGLLILGTALLNGLFMFFMRQTIIVMSRLIEYDLKNEIYEHYQKLDLAFYKRNSTGDLMNRISEDVSRVRMYIGPAIMYITNTVGTFVITIIFMFNENVKMSLYVLAPLPLLSIIIYYVSDAINKKSTKVQEQLSGISSFTQEAFSGIRVIKAYGKEKDSIQRLEKESEEYKKRSLSLAYTDSLFQPSMTLLIGLSSILTIYIGGMEAIKGNISIGNIPEFFLYVNRLTWPVASLGWVSSLIQRAAASQKRINEFLETEPEITSTSTNTSQKIKGNIEFKNVEFTYPDSGIVAVNNLSFKLEQGKSLAIIGKTGSGKSTLAQLICRLYNVNKGEILADEKNIKDIDLFSLRRSIGYVPQEVFLFSDTIANNISFSTIDEKNYTKEEIETAAKNAGIYNDIINFPEGFETKVGERGITLSGGQKQRISIARALIKKPEILIFDDCLSAVDTETEESILSGIKRTMNGKTSIIIGHRISSVKHADTIIVLEDGAVIETGTHEELMILKGSYFNTFQSQLLKGMVAGV